MIDRQASCDSPRRIRRSFFKHGPDVRGRFARLRGPDHSVRRRNICSLSFVVSEGSKDRQQHIDLAFDIEMSS